MGWDIEFNVERGAPTGGLSASVLFKNDMRVRVFGHRDTTFLIMPRLTTIVLVRNDGGGSLVLHKGNANDIEIPPGNERTVQLTRGFDRFSMLSISK